MTISAVDRIRLESMLGMLGSNHVGERDNASQLIQQFLRQRGLTWSDVLARNPVVSDTPGGRPYRGFQPTPPRAAAARPAARPVNDIVWRWSMLLGLIAVGSISLMTLSQQQDASQQIILNTTPDLRCPEGAEQACAPPMVHEEVTKAPTNPSPHLAVAAIASGNHKQPTAFAQGLADHQVAEKWHKLGLCAGNIGPDRAEFRSACITAEKLLLQFDRRRRAEPDYRRGWNSLPS